MRIGRVNPYYKYVEKYSSQFLRRYQADNFIMFGRRLSN